MSALIDKYQVDHVVVRGYLPWEKPSLEISKAQIASAQAKGCSVGMYFWAYRSIDPRETIKAAKIVMDGFSVDGILWLDCETYIVGEVADLGPDAAWLMAAGEEAKTLGVTPGIYSGRWWITSFLPGYMEFSDWPLWLAQYSGGATLDDVILPEGWQREKLLAKQYSDSDGIDLDVFRL